MMVYRASYYHPVHGHSWAWGSRAEEAIAVVVEALKNEEDTGPIAVNRVRMPEDFQQRVQWLNDNATRDKS